MTRTRIALITVAVALASAGLVGTVGNSASGRVATTSAHPAGLVPFRSCGDLLGYVKSQAVPLVGAWGLRRLARARPVAARRRRPGGRIREDGRRHRADRGRRLLRHERPGAGRRRARLRQDERQDPVRGRRQPAERGRRHELTPEAARLAEARHRLEPRAPARRRPPARALARRLLADAAARPDCARAAVLSRHVSHLGDRHLEPEGAAGRQHAHAQRRLRRRAPRRLERAHRRLLAGADEAALRDADRVDGRRACDGTRPEPRRRPVVPRRLLAPDLHDQARGPHGNRGTAARAVPKRRPPPQVLGPRDADRAHRRPGQGPRSRSTRSA